MTGPRSPAREKTEGALTSGVVQAARERNRLKIGHGAASPPSSADAITRPRLILNVAEAVGRDLGARVRELARDIHGYRHVDEAANKPQHARGRSAHPGTETRPRHGPRLRMCEAIRPRLFDHLVGTGEERRRHSDPNSRSRLDIEHKLVFCGCLHR
jgi:hypothetical protein